MISIRRYREEKQKCEKMTSFEEKMTKNDILAKIGKKMTSDQKSDKK